jgi:hypothetical protein
MRGGASYEDIMMMSYQERLLIADIVKDHMETTNKTRMPYF